MGTNPRRWLVVSLAVAAISFQLGQMFSAMSDAVGASIWVTIGTAVFGWLCVPAGIAACVFGLRTLREDRNAEKTQEVVRHVEHRKGWAAGRQAAAQLLSGTPMQPLTVWGVVLHPNERAYFDLQATYARYYGTDVVYQQVSGLFVGSASFVLSSRAALAVGNASRARHEAMQRWREHQVARVIATDHRMFCQGKRCPQRWRTGVRRDGAMR